MSFYIDIRSSFVVMKFKLFRKQSTSSHDSPSSPQNSTTVSDYSSTDESSVFDSPSSSPDIAAFDELSLTDNNSKIKSTSRSVEPNNKSRPTSCFVTPPLPDMEDDLSSSILRKTSLSLRSSLLKRNNLLASRKSEYYRHSSYSNNYKFPNDNISLKAPSLKNESKTSKTSRNSIHGMSIITPTTNQSSPSEYHTPLSGYRTPSSGYQTSLSGYRTPTSGYQTPISEFHSDFIDDDIPKRSELRPKSQRLLKRFSQFESIASPPSIYSPASSSSNFQKLETLPKINQGDINPKTKHQNLDKVLNKHSQIKTTSKSSSKSNHYTYKIPKLNEAENILKLKIFIGLANEDVIALKLRKDKLKTVHELIDVILYKVFDKLTNEKVSSNDIKISIFFKDYKLKPIVMKTCGDKNSQTSGLIQKDLLYDYIMAKNKVYIRAEY